MGNFWKRGIAQESKGSGLEEYMFVPMEDKYLEVYDLMVLPEYDKFFYDGDVEEFKYKVEMFSKGLTSKYSGTGAVALYKGKPIAFCVGITNKHYIVTATAPTHTGKGIGTLLLELTLRKYQLGHIRTALASTKKFNTPMQSILGRYGNCIEELRSENSYMYELSTDTERDLTPYKDCLAKMSLPK